MNKLNGKTFFNRTRRGSVINELTESEPLDQHNDFDPNYPMLGSVRQKPEYRGNHRQIFPRNNQAQRIQRIRRNMTINDIITKLITTVKQEFTVLPSSERYVKCLSFFNKLLEEADHDYHNLPRTIIFTSSSRQAVSLGLYLQDNCGIPCDVAPSNPTIDELKAMFQQCFEKEKPVLIFESRVIEPGVDNVDLVINYSLPSTTEEFGRRLICLKHKKCVTFVTCDEDRQLLRSISDIVEASGRDIPQSLKEVFSLYGGNFSRYLEEFKIGDSWIDLLDED